MNEYDFEQGMRIGASQGFYALLFALIRKADLINREKLRKVFPEEVAEFEDWRCGRRKWIRPVSSDDTERMVEDAELAGRD